MKRRRVIGLLIAGAIVAALWASTMLIAITDCAYICENTGSRKGYRKWFFGTHTNSWYCKSELEKFMEVSHPDLLKHRWTSFKGHGRSLIPFAESQGHGRPDPIYFIESKMLDEHVNSLSDMERLELYRTFSEAGKEAIQKRILSIREEQVEPPDEP